MRADIFGQRDGRSDTLTETRTDMTKVIPALRDYAKAPNICLECALNIITRYLYYNNPWI